jgi:hypothetical protein
MSTDLTIKLHHPLIAYTELYLTHVCIAGDAAAPAAAAKAAAPVEEEVDALDGE